MISSNRFYHSKHVLSFQTSYSLVYPRRTAAMLQFHDCLRICKLESGFEFWPSPDSGSSSKNPLKVFLLGVGEGCITQKHLPKDRFRVNKGKQHVYMSIIKNKIQEHQMEEIHGVRHWGLGDTALPSPIWKCHSLSISMCSPT